MVPGVVAATLLAFHLFILGPYTVYANNSVHYHLGFVDVLPYQVGAVLATVCVAALLLAGAPPSLRRRLSVLLLTLAVAAWLQGNVLLASYGVESGQGLELERNAWRSGYEVALWLGLIATGQWACRRLHPHVTWLALVLLATQAAALPFVISTTSTETAPEGRVIPAVPDEELESLSAGPNIVLLILDESTSDAFRRLLREDPRHAAETFAGFTFYADNSGAFPTTMYSIPAMLGRPPFAGGRTVRDYKRNAYREGPTISSKLVEAGWDVDVISMGLDECVNGVSTRWYYIPRGYMAADLQRLAMAAELTDYSLFRHVPHPLKVAVYDEDAWLLRSWLPEGSSSSTTAVASVHFFRDFVPRLRVDRDRPTFKMIHLNGGHGPLVLDRDCRVIEQGPKTDENYLDQVRCSLCLTAEFLDRLRALGVYDDATILVAADHGSNHGADSVPSHPMSNDRYARSRPLLAVKWPGRSGPMIVSDAPASTLDIAPTIAAAAGLPDRFQGRDLATLAADEERERVFTVYRIGDHSPAGFQRRLERYAVRGPNADPASWSFLDVLFAPDLDLDLTDVDLGTPDAADATSEHGWVVNSASANGTTSVSAIAPSASVYMSFGREAPVTLVTRLNVGAGSVPRRIDVLVDGEPVGHWTLESPGWREHSLVVPANATPPGIRVVTFVADASGPTGANARRTFFAADWVRVDS